MSKDPALLIYTKDFLEGTTDLSAEEFGAYVRLIFHQHQRGILPKDEKKLARLSGLSLSEFQLVWAEISHKFMLSENGYFNLRCAKEIAKRSQDARRKSILAVFGNWIKRYKDLTTSEIKFIKSAFSYQDYLIIEDEEERKQKIIQDLNNLRTAYAKRTHIEDVDVNENVNEKIEKGGVGEKTDFESKVPKSVQVFLENLYSFFNRGNEASQIPVFSAVMRIRRESIKEYSRFKEQTEAMIAYKKESGEIPHKWDGYLASYQSGKSEDWVTTLKNFRKNNGGDSESGFALNR